MVKEQRIWKETFVPCCEAVPWNLAGGTKKPVKRHSKNNERSGRNSNRPLHENVSPLPNQRIAHYCHLNGRMCVSYL
jgi:hypothetical protein